jgi:hypothetical protein
MQLEEILLSALPFVEDATNVSVAAETGIPFSRIVEVVNARMDKPRHERTIRRYLTRMAPYVDKVGSTRAARWFKTINTEMLNSQEHTDTNLAIALLSLDRSPYQSLPARARARLKLAQDGTLGRAGVAWKSKVARIDGTQPLILPAIDAGVYRQVSDALLHDRKLSFDYVRPEDETQTGKRYEALSPLALVNRAGVFYLVVMGAKAG